MKEFVVEYLKLLAKCILLICFSFVAFLFIINIYHYKEVTYVQRINWDETTTLKEYKSIMKDVDRKMKSVNHDNVNYSGTAKPIYQYYEACVASINNGTFSKIIEGDTVTAIDVYNANDDILKEYNNKCIFYIPYAISVINKTHTPSVSFNDVQKITEEKRLIVINNAEYLTHSGMGNSSYSFTTETTRAGVYNKVDNEAKLTVDNYRMMASILNDIADWYVDEFGGNA